MILKDLILLIVCMTKNVHVFLAEPRIKEELAYGPFRNNKEKANPCLVPYEELSNHKNYTKKETLTE